MEGSKISTPAEIAKEVHKDLTEVRGISLASAARKIGKTPQSLYNLLGGNRRFSYKVAMLMHREFGYSIPFLTEGIGSLNDNQESKLGRLIIKPNSSEPIHPYREYTTFELSTDEEQRLNDMKKAVEEAFFILRNHFETEDDVIIAYAPFIKSTKPEDFGITLHTQRARDLFQSFAFWAGMIQHLIDPGRCHDVIFSPSME